MTGAMQAARVEDTRKSRRINVRFRAEFTGRKVRGAGVVQNISLGGALIEQADPLLLSGGEVKVRFSFFENSVPVEVPAEIVRETSSGFAVRFRDLSRRMRSVLTVAISRAAAQDASTQETASTSLVS